ncbi:hypothetical protein ACWFRK_01040 [Streptomyces sp. NPDC055157]
MSSLLEDVAHLWVGLEFRDSMHSAGLNLPHRDRDFERIAAVIDRTLPWYGPEAGE